MDADADRHQAASMYKYMHNRWNYYLVRNTPSSIFPSAIPYSMYKYVILRRPASPSIKHVIGSEGPNNVTDRGDLRQMEIGRRARGAGPSPNLRLASQPVSSRKVSQKVWQMDAPSSQEAELSFGSGSSTVRGFLQDAAQRLLNTYPVARQSIRATIGALEEAGAPRRWAGLSRSTLALDPRGCFGRLSNEWVGKASGGAASLALAIKFWGGGVPC